MPSTENILESLLSKTETYGRTNYDLFTLRAANKTADVSARFLSRSFLVMAVSFFGLFINIGLSFWIGELLGKVYYGFGVIAGVYGILSVVLFVINKSLIKRLKDQIVSQLLN